MALGAAERRGGRQVGDDSGRHWHGVCAPGRGQRLEAAGWLHSRQANVSTVHYAFKHAFAICQSW